MPSPLKSASTTMGVLVSEAAVLVPVLYYFGSVYTRAWYSYFGIDSSMLGLSTTDLLRKSVTPTFWPVILALVVLLALLAARRLPGVLAYKTRNERRALRTWYLVNLSLGVVVLAVPPVIRLSSLPSWIPLGTYLLPGSLVIGSVLLAYATTLRTNNPDVLRPSSNPARSEPGSGGTAHATTVVIMVALFTLGLAGAIWGIGAYAFQQGIDNARTLARSGFPDQPSILVFSVDRLGIDGTGTQVDELNVPGEKYRYYYSGVRLLDRTPDAYFVIPQQWKARRDRVFVIPCTDNIRIDISTTRND